MSQGTRLAGPVVSDFAGPFWSLGAWPEEVDLRGWRAQSSVRSCPELSGVSQRHEWIDVGRFQVKSPKKYVINIQNQADFPVIFQSFMRYLPQPPCSTCCKRRAWEVLEIAGAWEFHGIYIVADVNGLV